MPATIYCLRRFSEHSKNKLAVARLQNWRCPNLLNGYVETFNLAGHPKAKRAYAWSHRSGKDDSDERFVAVLEIPPVDSPQTAVKLQTAAMTQPNTMRFEDLPVGSAFHFRGKRFVKVALNMAEDENGRVIPDCALSRIFCLQKSKSHFRQSFKKTPNIRVNPILANWTYKKCQKIFSIQDLPNRVKTEKVGLDGCDS